MSFYIGRMFSKCSSRAFIEQMPFFSFYNLSRCSLFAWIFACGLNVHLMWYDETAAFIGCFTTCVYIVFILLFIMKFIHSVLLISNPNRQLQSLRIIHLNPYISDFQTICRLNLSSMYLDIFN